MEETTTQYNSKYLYFKDEFGNYQPLGEPVSLECNRYIGRIPMLDIKIRNPKNIEQYMLEIHEEYEEKVNSGKIKGKVSLPERYIINENACILLWQNGEKTVVKRCADDEFNPRLAFLTAFFQHYCRNEQK